MPSGQYTWNTSTRRYMQGGRPMSHERLRSWVQLTVDESKEKLGKLAAQYQKGEINLAQWRISTGEELKRLHSAMGMMANGGRAQMTTKSWGRVGAKLKSEFAYLNDFRTELLNTDVEDLDGRFAARARMYADSAFSTYENLVKAREKDAGVKRARRHLEPGANHCHGCEGAASPEFRPIAEVPDIGTMECKGGCRCWIEYEEEDA